jgi:hypothetical protein
MSRSAPYIILAAILALPFGYFVGVVLAYLIAGPDMGVLPAATIPPALIAAFAIAFWPSLPPERRLAINGLGTVLLWMVAALLP